MPTAHGEKRNLWGRTYQGIHRILGSLLYAENCYIALYDDKRKLINFAFYADSVDTDWPDSRVWEPIGEGYAGGVLSRDVVGVNLPRRSKCRLS